jgi:hypothetical protein
MRNCRSTSFIVATLLAVPMFANANEDDSMNPFHTWLEAHAGTERSGTNELWLDPAGNEAELSDGSLRVESDGIFYTWSFRGTPHTGELRSGDGLIWTDSWHQPEIVQLEPVRDHGAIVAGEYSYPTGSGPDWHWRLKLVQRPDDTLILQMTNIASWGEEARAVRLTLPKAD